jgi:dihydrofolate reductase
MAASLDGFIARKDGRVDWLETADEFAGGETMDPGFVEAFLKSIGCYVMGSRTYETALSFEAKGLGWAYGDKPIFVLTSRKLPRTRDTVEFYSGDLAQFVNGRLRPAFRSIWFVGGGVVSGAPTGGNKGAGTVNGTAVYDDNVLLTCIGVEYFRDGKVSLTQWDALAPNGRHEVAHKFAEMLKTFDPRDPEQYISKMVLDGALPGMPSVADWQHNALSVGEMYNRLWLAVELLASAFAGSHGKRRKA